MQKLPLPNVDLKFTYVSAIGKYMDVVQSKNMPETLLLFEAG